MFRREAIENLEELHDYITEASSPNDATQYTDAIISYCEGLSVFPQRGSSRDDIRPGLRTVGYKKRVIIAFTVLNGTVAILGIFYGGRDYESILTAPDSPGSDR